METIEHKIGDTFCLEDGTKLEVIKATCNCKSCYFFNDKDNRCSRTKDIICSAPRRKDKEFVIFKQVKDNNMEEKRNIQIPLEEAREWYNSGDSFKRELALKAYSETELSVNTYRNILALLKDEARADSLDKSEIYRKLLNVAKYFNSLCPEEYNPLLGEQQYYIITKEGASTLYFKYKDFVINKSICKSDYEILFNTKEAAKRAIDILGNEINILFE